MDKLPLRDSIALFCRRVKKLSTRTRALYQEHLLKFADYCEGQGVMDWGAVTVELVESYIVWSVVI